MSASVLATGRAFRSQRAREISNRAGCRQAARARARIQQKSPRASSQISEFRSCMHSLSWIHARAGGWVAAHAMVWARLPKRRGLLNMFEKSAERKLKCARSLREGPFGDFSRSRDTDRSIDLSPRIRIQVPSSLPGSTRICGTA